MADDSLTGITEKQVVSAVMLDFTAAFDIIDHKILVEKLNCYGFSLSALLWMESYLNYRSHAVFFNGSFSEVEAGELGGATGKLPWTVALYYFHK